MYAYCVVKKRKKYYGCIMIIVTVKANINDFFLLMISKILQLFLSSSFCIYGNLKVPLHRRDARTLACDNFVP